jgi:hypothetical protein
MADTLVTQDKIDQWNSMSLYAQLLLAVNQHFAALGPGHGKSALLCVGEGEVLRIAMVMDSSLSNDPAHVADLLASQVIAITQETEQYLKTVASPPEPEESPNVH